MSYKYSQTVCKGIDIRMCMSETYTEITNSGACKAGTSYFTYNAPYKGGVPFIVTPLSIRR
ncbi:hypothetical protein FRX31_016906 [Thalictrum thalictroides]|uniref:Uncharacterized protein n=1 Tax=Thalictrum thalictroides TaxID=46969 RepID=A0A7J6W7Y9_THATH|nr:hypothetical protein FRX31_016906 [Thalictrum thalictroides]